MKKFLLFILALFISTTTRSQEWVNDDNFDDAINGQSGFDDTDDIVIIEFWADFNKDNAFVEWDKVDKIEGVKYFRADIAICPSLKKEYRIRMVPTILIFSGGDAFIKFKAKAGLDLLCPVDYPKMVRAIDVVRKEAQY
tara:strand:+ start:335 stop:751 length:417 start_codon:yes stop_codon:yes gene_type:complete